MYDVKVENNEVHLDIAEREAKILVWLGDNWQPPAPPAAEPAAESPATPATEPAVESTTPSQEQQPDSSTTQKPEATQSENPSQ
jgi:hypothetical protein